VSSVFAFPKEYKTLFLTRKRFETEERQFAENAQNLESQILGTIEAPLHVSQMPIASLLPVE